MQEFLLGSNEYESFNKHGFLVLRHFAPKADLEALQSLAQQQLANPEQPLELEAAVGYPGAPTDATANGGNTVRRQLGAYARHPLYKAWATRPAMVQALQTLFGNTQVFLSQAHHNCLMTKFPAFSSDTGWHQDIRYWAFQQPQLITAWLALGEEDARNGGLKVIPGSHRTSFSKEQFDENLFFRADLPENKAHIDQAMEINLAPGDVLFFHCKLLHCASRNHTDTPKLALVFTYRDSNNAPLANTRSASQPEIALAPPEPAPTVLRLI
ncbi:phytanoyl-CoA dioxygenase family protein [Saccharophagus degradans]|uniref:Phytanoyl-CoA dioxygenase family protein n=1 Tax=Saccharophagus degradans TaxID=86304 RepID=A0AAW7X5B6_9GAMM|nr:phytanoyl-CoA dioxygenase family protein [Saccharophagus degradans]MBU2985077.1 phytanoyl-CoA dioxygenase family protein [Saccharophagus degradans]MDO6421579.1 phytanoyl-CoA dioxygenase family protein [Saccharophagus degradans]MDO6608541.1 phytanoyl-CoA dioxygenase family protein [Saccharophagus degradans]